MCFASIATPSTSVHFTSRLFENREIDYHEAGVFPWAFRVFDAGKGRGEGKAYGMGLEHMIAVCRGSCLCAMRVLSARSVHLCARFPITLSLRSASAPAAEALATKPPRGRGRSCAAVHPHTPGGWYVTGHHSLPFLSRGREPRPTTKPLARSTKARRTRTQSTRSRTRIVRHPRLTPCACLALSSVKMPSLVASAVFPSSTLPSGGKSGGRTACGGGWVGHSCHAKVRETGER